MPPSSNNEMTFVKCQKCTLLKVKEKKASRIKIIEFIIFFFRRLVSYQNHVLRREVPFSFLNQHFMLNVVNEKALEVAILFLNRSTME